MPQIKPDAESFTSIKVYGVGGAGNNAVGTMIDAGLKGVEFITVNTDAQDLHFSKASDKIHIGKNATRGLGAGMDPDLGRQAAEESKEEIMRSLDGADMVFITAGMGGGTGTGATPVIAELSRAAGILTIAVVTKPFSFEGSLRSQLALEGLEDLRGNVDTLITIPNDRLLSLIDKRTTLLEAFRVVDDILRQAVQGISDLITLPGVINVDFADVRAIMKDAGSALIGIGRGVGDDRAVEAAKQAINSPLVEVSIDGARGLLFTISGGLDISMAEVNKAAEIITETIDPEAKIIFGAVPNPEMQKGELQVTVIATGFDKDRLNERMREVREIYRPEESKQVKKNTEEREEKESKKAEVIDLNLEEEELQEFRVADDEMAIPAFIRNKMKK